MGTRDYVKVTIFTFFNIFLMIFQIKSWNFHGISCDFLGIFLWVSVTDRGDWDGPRMATARSFPARILGGPGVLLRCQSLGMVSNAECDRGLASARLATYECVREICRRDEHGFFRTRSRNPSATRNCVTTDSAGWAGPAKSTDWPWSHFTLHFLTHLPPETLTYFLILEFIFGFFSKFPTFFWEFSK